MAALTTAVVVAHVVVLQATSNALQASEHKITRPFSTRMIEFKPAAETAAPSAPAPAPTKAPATRRASKPASTQVDSAPSTAASPMIVEQNGQLAHVEPAESAINTAANEVPPPAPAASAALPEPVASSPVTVAVAAPTPEPVAQAPLPAPAHAFTLPGSIRLKYNLEGLKDNLTYHARGEILWLHDGKTYDARMEISAFLVGSTVFTSTGTITAEGLAPKRYARKFRTELAAHFDYEKKRVTFSANTPDRVLLPGAQDQLSVMMQLAAMLAGEPARYPPGTSITLETIGQRDVETWVVTIEGEEKLSLPGGDIMTIKLSRGARREFDQKTELWLAPSLGYLPARIKITDRNNDFVDQVWRTTEAP